MATLFGNLPTAGSQSRSGSSALVAAGSIGGERALQWVYDEETSNCMHCNTPFTLLTRKVLDEWMDGHAALSGWLGWAALTLCMLLLFLLMCRSTTAGDAGT